jgi:hypothetical protein
LEYRNFVDELSHQALFKTRAFSAALSSKSESEGVMVFDGANTSRFRGKLAPLCIPTAQAPDQRQRYRVSISSLSIGSRQYTAADSLPVFLDTGAKLSLLPPALVDKIAADMESPGINSNGFYIVECALTEEDCTLDFAFGGVTVKVTYHEMVRQVGTGASSYFLAMLPSERFTLLGDSFLRSSYSKSGVIQTHNGTVAYLCDSYI